MRATLELHRCVEGSHEHEGIELNQNIETHSSFDTESAGFGKQFNLRAKLQRVRGNGEVAFGPQLKIRRVAKTDCEAVEHREIWRWLERRMKPPIDKANIGDDPQLSRIAMPPVIGNLPAKRESYSTASSEIKL